MEMKTKILQSLYPLTSFITKVLGVKSAVYKGSTPSKSSFYQLTSKLNNDEIHPFGNLRTKKTLIVNTATGCGYTKQLNELMMLKEKFPDLEILSFPSNDFKNQEKRTDAEIAKFCKVNYNFNLPLFKKSHVIGIDRNEVFEWLCNSELNGWNNKEPVWNFCKYLVNENGDLTHVFETGVEPLNQKIIDALKS